MQLEIAIGNHKQNVCLPSENVLDVLEQNTIHASVSSEDSVEAALKQPIASAMLEDICRAGEKIAIITSDVTRPLPSRKLLPSILERLRLIGCVNEDITIVFALGSHRHHSEQEIISLVGEDIYNHYSCIDSDPNETVLLGVTSHGTPVRVFRPVAEADRRICLGNIEYHYFAGYSGGAKAIMPGVSTRDAIQSNHSLMLEERSFAGNALDNPVRMDIEEAIQFCPIDFILNVILDEHKQIIHSVAGHYIHAHRAGCKFLDQLFLKPIREKADIVIVSQGGAPKDLNLYQTQKALDNAKHAVKDGGIIVLVGSCREGFGEKIFEQWFLEAKKPENLIARIREEFKLGGHKAAAIAMVLKKASIFLVSEMDSYVVRRCFMEPFTTVQEAVDEAYKRLGRSASTIVMPYGGSTLPRLQG